MRPPTATRCLLSTVPNAVNATLYDNLNFNFIRDIAPVAGIIRVPMVILVHPSVPAKTVPELIAYAKANPGKGQHGLGRHRQRAAHGRRTVQRHGRRQAWSHVPYRGQGPALTDLLGGQVQVLFATTPGTVGLYRHRQAARAGGDHRVADRRCCRTCRPVADFVPGYEASQWYGLSAPNNTPADDRRHAQPGDQRRVRRPRNEARFADIGGEPLAGSPDAFGKLIAEETEKWAKVVKSTGMKPE